MSEIPIVKASVDHAFVDVMTIGFEKDYIRFESTDWYKHNKSLDSWERVIDSSIIEDIFQQTLADSEV